MHEPTAAACLRRVTAALQVVYADGAGGHRTCTCAALGQGAQLVQVSRHLFMSFVMARPRTLQIYLHKVNSICHSLCVQPLQQHPRLFTY